MESKVEFALKQIYWLPMLWRQNGGSSIAATPVCWCCFWLLWVRISVCPSFLMGSLGGECHPSAGWMRCPKDLYQACLLSSSLLNCELDFSWSALWGYEFKVETKKGNKHHIYQHMSAWKHTVFGGSIHMHLKLFSCNVFSISPELLSLFQLPMEEAEKNGWCVRFGHCQRQACSRINSVLPNDHQLPHCQGRGPSVCRITVMKFG